MEFFSQIITYVHKLPFLIMGGCGIGFVIAFHELGHFIFCKLFNVTVPEFSIGFGPKMISKKIGQTTFALSLIPLGGYVETGSDDNDPNIIEKKPYWQKMCIVIGGILFNIIFAYTVLFILSMRGIPSNPFFSQGTPFVIASIKNNSAAEKSHLKPGDKIIEINNIKINGNLQKLLEIVQPLARQKVDIQIQRNNDIFTTQITLDERVINKKTCGSFGIEFQFLPRPALSFFPATIQAWNIMTDSITTTAQSFKNAFKKRSSENFAGPIMMITIATNSANTSFVLFLLLLVAISIGLAVLNVIPLPILDGGQALFYTIEAMIGKPIPPTIKNYIGLACWIFILMFFILLTYKDIKTLINIY